MKILDKYSCGDMTCQDRVLMVNKRSFVTLIVVIFLLVLVLIGGLMDVVRRVKSNSAKIRKIETTVLENQELIKLRAEQPPVEQP